jgi:hypothetical protein
MSFFDSEVVRSEIAEISELQEDLYKNVFKFPTMSDNEKISHIDLMQKLLNKQQVLYTRLSLSDDPEAIEMKNRIVQSVSMTGLPTNVDVNVIFNNMSKLISTMRESIDNTKDS